MISPGANRPKRHYRRQTENSGLLSGITRHDINNQLTILMGYLAMPEEKEVDLTLGAYFRMVATVANRIATMVQFTREYEEIGVHALPGRTPAQSWILLQSKPRLFSPNQNWSRALIRN